MSVYRLPTALTGRTLTCVRCGEPVRVFEPQGQFLNPLGYVCGQCLEPVRGREPNMSREGERRYESWLESLKDHGP